jgi:excisionase family DNA binding protein
MARTPRKQPASDPAALLERDGLIDSDTLAEYLNVPLGTLDQWASRGGGPPHFRVGKFRRYHPSDVRTWLDRQRRVVGNDLPAA